MDDADGKETAGPRRFKVIEEKAPQGRIYLTPRIKSRYFGRRRLGPLWRQNFGNGQWVVYTKAVAPYALSLRHFVPLAFVGSLLLLLALSVITGALFHPIGFLDFGFWNLGLISMRLLAFEVLLYASGSLFFTIATGLGHLRKCHCQGQGGGLKVLARHLIGHDPKGWACMALMPLVFSVLHFSYGFGSIWGILTLPWWLRDNCA